MSYSYKNHNLFDPNSKEPYKISRSKIDAFLNCPRCFYLDRRLGISQPQGPAFTLNSAVDKLLKREFDIHRSKGTTHPLMKHYGIDAIPFDHHKMNEWRENFIGVRYHYKPTNFIISGAIDDVWVDKKDNLIVVDYKATSTLKEISLEDKWKQGYKKQMEIYQWLLKKNGFSVSDTGYFVYCNAISDKKAFDAKLEFNLQIIPYKGDVSWIESTLVDIRKCLENSQIPEVSVGCQFCQYVKSIIKIDKPKRTNLFE
ncbi:MAG: PD-(D/E)XK nuclease family protein [Candidatus Berkelbacteria bacterium]|nr:PD-(D/E)XK nuclease family protein [Candidatus Berkelbacteria bacterium]